MEALTISQHRKAANNGAKFVLYSNEFGFDMWFADPEKYAGIITDDISEALEFSQVYDNRDMKAKANSIATGYNFKAIDKNY